MKLSQKVNNAINNQIKNEFDNAFLYLSIATWCEENNLPGFAKWNLAQFKEEQEHAMKFYNYIFERQGTVKITDIKQPQNQWSNIIEVFEYIIKKEEETTKQLYELYDIAKAENDYTTITFLQWYLNEQVEEEATANSILNRLQTINNSASAIMFIDSEISKR